MKLNRLAGFRSNKTWKKITASIYYFFLFSMAAGFLLSLLNSGDLDLVDRSINAITGALYLALEVLPLLIVIKQDDLEAKYRILRKGKALLWIAFVAVIFVVLPITSSLNELHTPAYAAAQEINSTIDKISTLLNTQPTVRDTGHDLQTTSAGRPAGDPDPTATTGAAAAEPSTAKPSAEPTSGTSTGAAEPGPGGELLVHFIDVGQADCILIQQDNAAMLIDAGNNADAALVVSYIRQQGIHKLDLVIGTHPHEDHIGGLDTVIDTFDIGKVILPAASNTTQTFKDVLLAIKAKGLKITRAVPGSEFILSEAKLKIFGPVLTSFDDLNDSSVVSKITFGRTSFLFAGDAEGPSEQAMLKKGFNLNADILKIGHHGSSSSSSSSFLKAVSPQFAVICVGSDNSYGHPTGNTLASLEAAGISLFRTDICGTIIALSDGRQVSFNAKPDYGSPGTTETTAATVETTARPTAGTTASPTVAPTKPDSHIVYITKTGEKYHRAGCRYLSKSKIAIELALAIDRGLTPCSVCDP